MSSTLHVRPGRTKRAQGHDLEQAYDEHGAAVYGLAYRITGNEAEASRMTADVFAGLQEIGVGADNGLRGCLLADVHRRAVAWKRSSEGARSMDLGLPLDGLAMLDDDERAVVAEAYFGGKTYEEIARNMQISRADAARLMQQALHHLGSATTSSPRLSYRPKTA